VDDEAPPPMTDAALPLGGGIRPRGQSSSGRLEGNFAAVQLSSVATLADARPQRPVEGPSGSSLQEEAGTARSGARSTRNDDDDAQASRARTLLHRRRNEDLGEGSKEADVPRSMTSSSSSISNSTSLL
jgi:hypothetical protein